MIAQDPREILQEQSLDLSDRMRGISEQTLRILPRLASGECQDCGGGS